MNWNDTFLALFGRSLTRFQGRDFDFANYYNPQDLRFLASIGCQPREFYDFVEDHGTEGEPSISTALLVAAVRRDYFNAIQERVLSTHVLTSDDLPTFGDELEGMVYLPRILAKARAKLRGELDPDIMFCCGGDRNFLAKHGHIHPADFLRVVWSCGDDDAKLAAWVRLKAS
jgi:Domain of unknown function (DUF5069)